MLFVVLIGVCYGCGVGLARSILLAFVAAAIVFLVLIAHMFARADTASIRARAREEDQGRWGALWSSVVVSGVALVALGLELHASQSGGALEIALAATTLLLSWMFMNTMFAIHYAHAFYGDDAHKRKRGGLDFPGEGEADYWDFVYFAFVIGMTFQVSDVQVSDRRLRRIVLVHGVIAFFFNVIIIALSVNVVAGKA
ncbi:MAG TPA: DUF1345 domain-containing protein [Dokdonella sp.]